MRNSGLALLIPALFCGFLSLPVRAQAEPEIAFVLKVTGEARVKSGAADWVPLKQGARLHDQDRIRTGAETLVAIVFLDDKTMMKIHASSEVKIVTTPGEKGLHKRIIMEMGQMWSKVVPGRGGYQVETPSGVAAVKGTEFYTLMDASGETIIIGLEGLVEFFNEMGSVLVKPGETGRALKGRSPQVEPTSDFDDWAAVDRIQELDLEYRNDAGDVKHLKIKYK